MWQISNRTDQVFVQPTVNNMAWVLTAFGFVLLVVAGDFLVRGAVNLSLRLGIPALIVSLTIVAFGTSAPELLVAIQAATAGCVWHCDGECGRFKYRECPVGSRGACVNFDHGHEWIGFPAKVGLYAWHISFVYCAGIYGTVWHVAGLGSFGGAGAGSGRKYMTHDARCSPRMNC